MLYAPGCYPITVNHGEIWIQPLIRARPTGNLTAQSVLTQGEIPEEGRSIKKSQ